MKGLFFFRVNMGISNETQFEVLERKLFFSRFPGLKVSSLGKFTVMFKGPIY